VSYLKNQVFLRRSGEIQTQGKGDAKDGNKGWTFLLVCWIILSKHLYAKPPSVLQRRAVGVNASSL
jgi:hypothetical protein